MAIESFRGAAAAGLLALALVAHAGAAGAQSASKSRHTKVSLLAETDGVVAGQPLHVGIRLQMDPSWHTYWRNPGDAGLPTRVQWTLPAGFEPGEVGWPYPIRFATGLLASYGYEHEVLLPVEIRVPARLDAREVTLVARVAWLECQEACLPGKTEVSLRLPVRATVAKAAEAPAFAKTRRRLPVADPAWGFSATPAQDAIVLAIRPPRGVAVEGAHFFATTRRVLDYAKPQPLERAKTGYRLRLARDPNGAPAARLAGVLVVSAGGRERALEVDVGL